MISLRLAVSETDKDRVVAELWELGTLGITEEPGGLRAFFEQQDDSLIKTFAAFHPEIFQETERDWEAEAQAAWQPFAVGERFYLVPEWRDDPAPCGRVRLRTYPGMACGTGAHPATQLCLQAMERYPLEGKRMLDVGAGSGILAQAARLLGADPVIGCDIEHASTMVAAANIRKSILPVALFTGSVRSVKSDAIEVIVANLNAATLKQIASELNRIAAPGAVLILSGFLHSEADAVAQAIGRAPRAALRLDEWSCIVF